MSTLLQSSNTTVHYTITADAHSGALPRVLELFALRNITPDLVKVSKFKPSLHQEGNLSIDVHISGLGTQEQELILHKLEAQVSVQYVREEILYRVNRTKLAPKSQDLFILNTGQP